MWSRLLALALTCALLLPPVPALAGVKEKIAGLLHRGSCSWLTRRATS